jgi:hypothetical protein
MNLRKNLAAGTCGPNAVQRNRMRMQAALALSLLFHAFLLSLQFGTRGLGLPGLHMPWEERRAQTPGITVRIADARRHQSAAVKSTTARPATEGAAATGMPVPPPKNASADIAQAMPPHSSPRMKVVRRSEAPVAKARTKERKAAPEKPRHKTRPHARRGAQRPASRAKSHPPIVMKKPAQPDSFVLPPPDESAEPLAAAIPLQDPTETARMRIEEEARRADEIARQAAQRQAEEEQAHLAEQLLAERLAQESAQRKAAELAARRQAEEAAREAVEKAARQAAQWAEEEVQRQERLHVQQRQAQMLDEENARRRAMEEEEHRRTAERLREESEQRTRLAEAQRQEAERVQRLAEEQAAQRQAEEAARRQDAATAEQQDRGTEGGGEAQRRGASGTQYGETPDTGQAELAYAPAESPARVPPIEDKSSNAGEVDDGPFELSDEQMAAAHVVQVRKVDVTRLEPQAARELVDAAPESRRRSIFGGAEDDIVLKMYIAEWRQTVERNGNRDDEASSMDKPFGDSLVTVALRSDGRIESVTIHRSNGHTGLGDAVRRIVQVEARYKDFPPDLMRRYDVIEIRRVWQFGDGLRILEEAR